MGPPPSVFHAVEESQALEPAFASAVGDSPGSGNPNRAYSQEVAMHKLDRSVETSLDFDPCGIEVSSRTLVVRRRCQGKNPARRSFDNTPIGHQSLLAYLPGPGRAL